MVLMKSSQKRLKKRDLAPKFSLMNVDGKAVSIDDFRDHQTAIIFMCNHCPYVKAKLDEIAAIQDKYSKKGVVFLCINSNDPTDFPEDNFENMKIVAKDTGLKY